MTELNPEHAVDNDMAHSVRVTSHGPAKYWIRRSRSSASSFNRKTADGAAGRSAPQKVSPNRLAQAECGGIDGR